MLCDSCHLVSRCRPLWCYLISATRFSSSPIPGGFIPLPASLQNRTHSYGFRHIIDALGFDFVAS